MNDRWQGLPSLLRWHFARIHEGRCPREIDLALFVARDLSPDDRSEFEVHLRGCLECRTDLQRFEADVRERSLETSRPRPWLKRLLPSRPLRWALVGAALGAAILVISIHPPGKNLLRPKGKQEFQLHVAVSHEGRAYRVRGSTQLEPGDQLGFFYTSHQDGYLMVIYANQSQIVRIFPAEGSKSAGVRAGSEVRVPDGATFNPGHGCEWIVGMFSARPIDDREAADLVKGMIAGRQDCSLSSPQAGDVKMQIIEVGR